MDYFKTVKLKNAFLLLLICKRGRPDVLCGIQWIFLRLHSTLRKTRTILSVRFSELLADALNL